MVTAYVIIKVDPGKESQITQQIISIEGIAEGALTWGYSDILIKVNVESTEKLRDIVLNTIQKIPGITDTQTIIVSEYFL